MTSTNTHTATIATPTPTSNRANESAVFSANQPLAARNPPRRVTNAMTATSAMEAGYPHHRDDDATVATIAASTTTTAVATTAAGGGGSVTLVVTVLHLEPRLIVERDARLRPLATRAILQTLRTDDPRRASPNQRLIPPRSQLRTLIRTIAVEPPVTINQRERRRFLRRYRVSPYVRNGISEAKENMLMSLMSSPVVE